MNWKNLLSFVLRSGLIIISYHFVLIVQGVVKKKRLLYLVGQTRVHCDEVEGLGHFVELEVCSLPLLLMYCTE